MNYDESNPPHPSGMNVKEYLESHIHAAYCGICHVKMEPGNGIPLIYVGGMTDAIFHKGCWDGLRKNHDQG